MIFIPVKWIPWLLAIAGIGLIIGGITAAVNGDDGVAGMMIGGVIFLVGGILWIRYNLKNRKPKMAKVSSPAVPASTAAYGAGYCGHCGAALEQDVVFCEKCGTKRDS